MQISPSHSIFSGIPVRSYLKQINYASQSIDTQIALALIFATDQNTTNARRNSHLTNATEKEHQIRFPLKDRVQRAMVKLAAEASAPSQFTVEIAEDDFLSLEFFKAIPEARIGLIELGSESTAELSGQEKDILYQLTAAKENLAYIIDKCHERIFASDYRSALKILARLPEELQADNVHYMMGLCNNFFGRTEQSEIHFRQMLASADPNSRVKAAYVTSMLYLRMHPKERQSLEVAEELLQTAYETLTAHPEVNDWMFHRVFNRNGYALCLYRRGKVEEALAMLENGIKILKQDLSGANRLHQSVLIYNAVQCLSTLGRFQHCEAKCEELLGIDPLFPEYHLEQARVFLEQNKNAEALQAIRRAEALDRFIPELHALKGFAYLQLGEIAEAAAGYAEAAALQPSNPQFRSDLEYCQSEMELTA